MLTDKLIPGKIVHWTNFDTAMMMYKYCEWHNEAITMSVFLSHFLIPFIK